MKVSVQINPHQATKTSFKVTSNSPSAMSASVECAAVISDHRLPDSLKKVPAVRAARFLSSGSSTPATLQRKADRRIVVSASTRGDIMSASTFNKQGNSAPEVVSSSVSSGESSCIVTLTLTFAGRLLGPCSFLSAFSVWLGCDRMLTRLSMVCNFVRRSLSFLIAADSSACFWVHSVLSCVGNV